MDRPSRYIAVFDASVLVPGFLANFLLWLAQTDLFQARWSPDIHDEWIHDEWIRNRKKRYTIEIAVSEARRQKIDEKFPHGLVTGYEDLIDSLNLNVKDRHVLAAAIKCGANAIVTTNIKHFPSAELDKYNVVAITQDDFVLDQLGLSAGSASVIAAAIVAHKKSMWKSRTTWRQYFESIARPGVGLSQTFAELSKPEFKGLIAETIRLRTWLED